MSLSRLDHLRPLRPGLTFSMKSSLSRVTLRRRRVCPSVSSATVRQPISQKCSLVSSTESQFHSGVLWLRSCLACSTTPRLRKITALPGKITKKTKRTRNHISRRNKDQGRFDRVFVSYIHCFTFHSLFEKLKMASSNLD